MNQREVDVGEHDGSVPLASDTQQQPRSSGHSSRGCCGSEPKTSLTRRWTASPLLLRVRAVAGRQRQAVPLHAHGGTATKDGEHEGAPACPAVPAPSDPRVWTWRSSRKR